MKPLVSYADLKAPKAPKAPRRLARTTQPKGKGGRRFKHAVRDPAKLAWLRLHEPCVVARKYGWRACTSFRSDPHHEPKKSMGGGDDQVSALCAGPTGHHEERERTSREAFEAKYRISFAEENLACEARWRASQAGGA